MRLEGEALMQRSGCLFEQPHRGVAAGQLHVRANHARTGPQHLQ